MRPLLFFIFWSLPLFSSEEVFQKKKIQIKNLKITVEVAQSESEHARGLMFRSKLEKNTGMLFIFEDERPRSFWMKNTFIPLTIAYFDKDKKLIETLDMEPVKSEMDQAPRVYPSSLPAQYALEMPRGWFKKNNIKVGDKLIVH